MQVNQQLKGYSIVSFSSSMDERNRNRSGLLAAAGAVIVIRLKEKVAATANESFVGS